MPEMTREGLCTIYDKFFAKTKSFVYEVKDGRADLGSVSVGRTEYLVDQIDVVNTGTELVEVLYLKNGQTLSGRRRRIAG